MVSLAEETGVIDLGWKVLAVEGGTRLEPKDPPSISLRQFRRHMGLFAMRRAEHSKGTTTESPFLHRPIYGERCNLHRIEQAAQVGELSVAFPATAI